MHIARDAPATASAYVRRLRESVGRLREFPFSGQVVREIGREDIREILRVLAVGVPDPRRSVC